MAEYSILVSAISDVGYWRWWSEALPELFQLEFGGVQIYLPPSNQTEPPSSLLALRFLRPSRVSFIRRKNAAADLPADWPHQLKADMLDPFGVSYEEFAVGDATLFREICDQVENEIIHFADDSGGKDLLFAFWAGGVGVRIEAAEMRPILMTGEVSLATIATLHRDWWAYWRDYWNRRTPRRRCPRILPAR